MPPPAQPPRRDASEEEITRQWHRMAGVGFEFLAAILLFGGIGWLLDWGLGWSPWGLVGGLAVGFVAGMWQLVRVGLRSFRE